jgi:hypothetical protein
VVVHPIEVGVHRRDDAIHRAVEVAVERDPVALADRVRDLLVEHRAVEQGTMSLWLSTA